MDIAEFCFLHTAFWKLDSEEGGAGETTFPPRVKKIF